MLINILFYFLLKKGNASEFKRFLLLPEKYIILLKRSEILNMRVSSNSNHTTWFDHFHFISFPYYRESTDRYSRIHVYLQGLLSTSRLCSSNASIIYVEFSEPGSYKDSVSLAFRIFVLQDIVQMPGSLRQIC